MINLMNRKIKFVQYPYFFLFRISVYLLGSESTTKSPLLGGGFPIQLI